MTAPIARDPLYRGYRFPPEIISYAVCLYFRFALSHRDVEELLAERGVQVSYEAIRLWCRRGIDKLIETASSGWAEAGRQSAPPAVRREQACPH